MHKIRVWIHAPETVRQNFVWCSSYRTDYKGQVGKRLNIPDPESIAGIVPAGGIGGTVKGGCIIMPGGNIIPGGKAIMPGGGGIMPTAEGKAIMPGGGGIMLIPGGGAILLKLKDGFIGLVGATMPPGGGRNLLASSRLGLAGNGGISAISPCSIFPMCPRAATILSRYLIKRSVFSIT